MEEQITEFDKNRISYSIAIIASSFALYPILKDMNLILPQNYQLKNIKIAFWIFNCCIGLSMYLYGLSLISKNKLLRRTKKIADKIYFFSMLLPVIYFIYYFIDFMVYYFKKKNLTFSLMFFSPVTSDTFYNILEIFSLLLFSYILVPFVKDIFEVYKNNEKITLTRKIKVKK